MTSNSSRITLIAPGCFSELVSENSTVDGGIQPENSTGEVAEVNHASVISSPASCFEMALLHTLDQAIKSPGELPIAQHQFAFETESDTPADCVCAELVHLQADTSNARLIPTQVLDISMDESEQLLQLVNQLINADGMSLVQSDAGSLYLHGMPAALLDTWPAHALATGKIANYLPRHSQAGEWRRLLTEVQMLFHSHPVNAARVENQQLPINAIWFWGGQRLEQYAPTSVKRIYAADAFSSGFAKSLGVELVNTKGSETPEWVDVSGDVLVVELGVYHAWLRGDLAALKQAKQDLNSRWIEPAQKAVANGTFKEMVLDGCEGRAILETQRSATNNFSTVTAGFKTRLAKLFGKASKHNRDAN